LIFKSMNHVPPRLRKLRGVPLSSEQVEELMGRAQELASTPQEFPGALATARMEFQAKYESSDSGWIARSTK
jgi:hypothetical protein